MNDDFLGIRQACLLLKVTPPAIYCAVKKGLIPTKKVDDKFIFKHSDLLNYKKNKYSRKHSKIEGKDIFGPGEFSVMEISKRLKINISQLYYLLKAGHFPHSRKGSAYVISQADLDKYLNRR